MPYNNNQFFVKGLNDKAEYWIHQNNKNGPTLFNAFSTKVEAPKKINVDSVNKIESDEKLYCTDLLCEGPIEGLVDKYGNVLKYGTSTNPKDSDDTILGKGIYYNDVPLIDSKLNKFNFVSSGFEIDYGEEVKNYNYGNYPSTVYKYDQKLYLSEIDSVPNFGYRGYFQFIVDETNNFIPIKLPINDLNWYFSNQFTSDFIYQSSKFNVKNIVNIISSAKNNCQEFTHKIYNKFCDNISINLTVNSLFNNNSDYSASFAIEISEDFSSRRYYCIVAITGFAKSAATISIPIDLNLNSVENNNYYVKVFSLTKKIDPANNNQASIFCDFSVSSVVERILTKGYFVYPYSCTVKTVVSSRHFNSDPNRTFDLKLLKIKTPSNYDPEAREYNGNWNGKFNNFLRWTDNPAWVFFDICTNSRYGLGNGLINESDINKWELYKLSQYCDDLVKVNVPYSESEDSFEMYYTQKNKIYIQKNNRSLEFIKKKYKPVYDTVTDVFSNDSFYESLIFLYDMKNADGDIEKNYKKIIWSVKEVNLFQDGQSSEVSTGGGTHFEIQLINDFGPKSFFETDLTGLLNSFLSTSVNTFIKNSSILSRVSIGDKNTQSAAKAFILTNIANSVKNNTSLYNNILNKNIVDDDLFVSNDDFTVNVNSSINGKCLPRSKNYRDPLEPRFSCNLLIDNETNSLKLLSDICSIFRGISYYKNNYIGTTYDVQKPVVYLFNNSNVKDGAFFYSSGSLEGLYSVAKISFKDQYDNFNDSVEIVEDAELLKNYGVIIKEILGFGITSRDQARRIGEWLLMTNRLENQSVNFSTDLQGILLKPGDVIEIKDQYKNNSTLQGRVVNVDLDDNSIVVDRQLNLNLIGQKIKFIFSNYVVDSSLNGITATQANNIQILELKIKNIDNSTNKVWFDADYNYSDFNKIISSTVFIIDDLNINNNSIYYKIVSISESNNNEYGVFAIKYDSSKYTYLDKNLLQKDNDIINNTISYSNIDFLQEITIPINQYIVPYSINADQVPKVAYDYSFTEQTTLLSKIAGAAYSYINISFSNIFNYINNSNSEYYKKIQLVLNDKGGLLCVINLKNQSLKFKITADNVGDKNVFMGRFGINAFSNNASAYIKLYLFDKNNKLINI